LLHLAAYNNATKCFNQVIVSANSEAEERMPKERKGRIVAWVNAMTKKDRFRALHYASFRGNVKMCRVLIEMGAVLTA